MSEGLVYESDDDDQHLEEVNSEEDPGSYLIIHPTMNLSESINDNECVFCFQRSKICENPNWLYLKMTLKI